MRRQMNAVGDETRRQPVFRQLGEKRIVELRQQLGQSIAEMCRQTCSSFGGGCHRCKSRSRMADGDDASLSRHDSDEGLAACKFGGDRHEQNGACQRPGQPLDEGCVRGPHGCGRMASRITVTRIEERPFEVIARDHQRPEPALRDSPVQGAESGFEHIVRRSDQSRQAGRDAGGEHRLKSMIESIGVDGLAVEVDACEAVDLKVEEPARPHPVLRLSCVTGG